MTDDTGPERVRLRLPTVDDVPLLDAWAASVEAQGEFNDLGQPPRPSYGETAANAAFITETHGALL